MVAAKVKSSKRFRQRFKALKQARTDFESEWKILADYMRPWSGRYLLGDTDKRDDLARFKNVINNCALESQRTLGAGLQGGLASPSRPWFRLALTDLRLMESSGVREWLSTVRDLMLQIFARSNVYGSLYEVYQELSVFGTGAMIIDEDFDTVIRCRPMTIGEYYLGLDRHLRPDTLYRRFSMTARQMVNEFGEDSVSQDVKTAMQNNNTELRFNIIHCIEPNNAYAIGREDSASLEYLSVYYEEKSDEDKLLRVSGYRGCPFMAPRWTVIGDDAYGIGCGHIAIADDKMLQKMESKKLRAIDKMVDPPMVGPSSLKKSGNATLMPGGISYIDTTGDGKQAFLPAHEIRLDLSGVSVEIERVEARIERAFYTNLFLAIIAQDKQMTAHEVAERSAEKMVMLGPAIDRIQAELLDRVIDRTFSAMQNLGLLPEAPEELQGQDLKVEYISMLAQAQKMSGLTGIEQFAGFVGNISQINPDVLDKFNTDKAADEYGEAVGIPPELIRDAEEVEELREARRQQQQQAAMQESMAQGAQTAKTASEIDVSENGALKQLLGGIGGGNG